MNLLTIVAVEIHLLSILYKHLAARATRLHHDCEYPLSDFGGCRVTSSMVVRIWAGFKEGGQDLPLKDYRPSFKSYEGSAAPFTF
jgi:hypothetical protein